MMWEAWQKDYAQLETTTPMPEQNDGRRCSRDRGCARAAVAKGHRSALAGGRNATSPELEVPPSAQESQARGRWTVVTDLFALTISTIGGGIDHAALLAYPIRIDTSEPIALLQSNSTRTFIYQSGLKSPEDPEKPTHAETTILCIRPRANITNWRKETDLLTVPLHWQRDDGVSLTKNFSSSRAAAI